MRRACTGSLPILVVVLLAAVPTVVSKEIPRTLKIGVLPYLNVHLMLEKYQDMRVHLEKKLDTAVQLVSAPDYRTYFRRTMKGSYRYVFTAAHFARLNQLDGKWIPVLRPVRGLYGIVLVPPGSGLRGIEDLKGKTLATPDSMAIITILGEMLLKDSGLLFDEQIRLRNFPSHSAAVLAVSSGKADAAVVSVRAYSIIKPKYESNLEILAKTREVPAPLIYMAAPGVGDEEIEKFREALVEFVEETPEGRDFLNKTGYGGLTVPAQSELDFYDPYIDEVRARLDRME